jgi:hypothetical protein
VEDYGWHRTPKQNITAEPTTTVPTTIVTTAPTPAPTTIPVTTNATPLTVTPKPAAAQTVNVPLEIGIGIVAVITGLWRFRNAN